MVSANEKALSLARSYKINRTVSILSFITIFSGLIYSILGKEGSNET